MRSAILLLANIGVVLAELVQAPINTVVVAGELMRMECVMRNNSKVRNWDIFTTNLSPYTIYSPHKFHSLFKHFGVDVDDNGSGILYTNSTHLSDAGIYKCLSIIDGQDKEHSSQLIVLESMPICEESYTLDFLNPSKSMLNNYIWMQCNLSFKGFWTPTIEWIEYGDHVGPKGKIVTEGVEVTQTTNKIVSSNLTIAVNSSRNGSRFACKIYFAKYNGTYDMTARNVPNFTYTWLSSIIPSSFSSPEYVSKELDTLESSTVTSMIDLLGNPQEPSSPDWYIISISLVAALSVFLIIIIVLVVVFCIRFKKKLSAKYTAALEKFEMPICDGDYDILPYATSDNYETIDDVVINADLKVSCVPRQGPLPTPGYSGLAKMEPTVPGVYSGIDTNETPVDVSSGSRDTKVLDTLETSSEEQIDERGDKKDRESAAHAYIEVFDVVEAANPETISGEEVDNSDEKTKAERDSQQDVTQATVHPYIELLDAVVADDVEKCKRTSHSDISADYLTVNF